MKRIIIKKQSIGTVVKRPLLVAYSEDVITDEQIAEFRRKIERRCVNSSTMTVTTTGKLGNVLMIFDFYVIEHLSLFQRFRHCFSMVKTAVLGYVGVNTVISVVV